MTRGAEKVRAWRAEAKLSQGAAAERAGVSQNTWSDWEKGTKRPAIEHMVTLAALTAASKHAITLHDFVESVDEAAERRARRQRRSA